MKSTRKSTVLLLSKSKIAFGPPLANALRKAMKSVRKSTWPLPSESPKSRKYLLVGVAGDRVAAAGDAVVVAVERAASTGHHTRADDQVVDAVDQ